MPRPRNEIFKALFFLILSCQPVFAAEGQAGTSLDFADGLYARKMYGPAVTEYEKFIRTNPQSPDLGSARFRYADSFYFSKDYASSIANFEIFLNQFPRDPRVSLAEFRLATARYYSGDVRQAIRLFSKLSLSGDRSLNSEKELSDLSPEQSMVRDGAVFYLAKSLEDRQKNERAASLYGRLANSSGASEYISYAAIALGDLYLKTEDYPEALAAYKIAAARPEMPALAHKAAFKVAEIAFDQKNYDQAAGHYERTFHDSNDPVLKSKALLGLFYCDYYRQDLEAMEKRFAAEAGAIASNPYKADIYFLIAGLQADTDQHEKAVATLDEIMADTQTTAEVKEKARLKKIFSEAEVLARSGHQTQALEIYEKLEKDFPGSDTAKIAQFQAATSYLRMGQAEKAREAFTQFAERYAHDEAADMALLQLIQIDLDAKNFGTAHRDTSDFIENRSKSRVIDVAYYKLGVAATGLQKFKEASDAFQKVITDYPASTLYPESLYGAAVSFESAQTPEPALPLYERLLQLYPAHPLASEVRAGLGYLYIQVGDKEKAEKFYQAAILNQTGPVDTGGIFWLIQRSLDKGDYATLDRVLEALPGRFPGKDLKHEIFFFKGESALGQNDFPKAVEFYSKAVEARPLGEFVPPAHLGMGVAYAAMNDSVNAEKNFNETLKYDQDIRATARARFEMANMRLRVNDIEGAAKGFMLVAILYDDAKYTPMALYKAGECFASLDKQGDADKAFQELRSRYPKSIWAKKIQHQVPAGG